MCRPSPRTCLVTALIVGAALVAVELACLLAHPPTLLRLERHLGGLAAAVVVLGGVGALVGRMSRQLEDSYEYKLQQAYDLGRNVERAANAREREHERQRQEDTTVAHLSDRRRPRPRHRAQA